MKLNKEWWIRQATICQLYVEQVIYTAESEQVSIRCIRLRAVSSFYHSLFAFYLREHAILYPLKIAEREQAKGRPNPVFWQFCTLPVLYSSSSHFWQSLAAAKLQTNGDHGQDLQACT